MGLSGFLENIVGPGTHFCVANPVCHKLDGVLNLPGCSLEACSTSPAVAAFNCLEFPLRKGGGGSETDVSGLPGGCLSLAPLANTPGQRCACASGNNPLRLR